VTARRAQVVGTAVAFAGFAIVVQQVMATGPLVDLDRELADHYGLYRIHSSERLVGHGAVQTVARILTPFGDAVLLLTAVGVLALFVYRKGRRRESMFLATAAIGGVLLDLIVRVAFGHVRPDLPFPYSVLGRFGLPSGHALDATVCFGAVLVVLWPQLSRRWKVVATVAISLLVAGVSHSRVVLLTHYLSDVIAGVTLGLAWLLLMGAAFSLPRRDRLPSIA
jgi:undecaprenyl-diphosphatase